MKLEGTTPKEHTSQYNIAKHQHRVAGYDWLKCNRYVENAQHSQHGGNESRQQENGQDTELVWRFLLIHH